MPNEQTSELVERLRKAASQHAQACDEAADRITALEAELARAKEREAKMREALGDRELFIRAMLDLGSYWRVNTREFCHRGICHSLTVENGVPQLTDHLRAQLRTTLQDTTS